ncbi:MAG: hypothetical protein ISS31_08600 [Kiritimatiellae bacterium]|nr:hypothetical protein [Kiritimatiellia bacterium]
MTNQCKSSDLGRFLAWREDVLRRDITYMTTVGQHVGNELIYQGARTYGAYVDRYPNEAWHSLWQAGADVVTPDPFASSKVRSRGMQVWDSLRCIPRNPAIESVSTFRNIVARRNCNTTWLNEIGPAIRHAGPILGQPQRPTHPWIIDLSADPFGWFWLEAAHVLTHQRLDSAEHARLDPLKDVNPYPTMFYRAVAEIALGVQLGIPIDVSQGVTPRRKWSHLPYGLDVCTTPYWHVPLLRFPWQGVDAPIFDGTLAIVDVGVYIHPIPSASAIATKQPEDNCHWSCAPTMVVVAGWESVDVVARQQVVIYPRESGASHRFTALHPSDLMPVDTLPAYLELGKQHAFALPNGGDWQHARNWMQSPEYTSLYQRTPPLPCPLCMAFNPLTQNNPRKPGKQPFGTARSAKARRYNSVLKTQWQQYASEVRCIRKVIEKGTEVHEAELHGGDLKAARRIRRERKAAHKAVLQKLKDKQTLDSAIHKELYSGKPLGKREREALATLRASGVDIITLANRRGRA